MEFIRYGKHRRHRASNVIQNAVIQKSQVIHCRVDEQFYKELKELSDEKHKTISEMTRLLWRDYLTKKRIMEWRKEVGEWGANEKKS